MGYYSLDPLCKAIANLLKGSKFRTADFIFKLFIYILIWMFGPIYTFEWKNCYCLIDTGGRVSPPPHQGLFWFLYLYKLCNYVL